MVKCRYCGHPCVRAGKRKNQSQTYRCKGCARYQQVNYKNLACKEGIVQTIPKLLTEGVGINSIARILKISVTTVIRMTKRKATSVTKPAALQPGRVYEMDELWTFVGSKKKETWVSYVMDRESKQVVDFKVGARTKENLKAITDQVLFTNPKKVCTDGLNIYKTIVPERLHKVGLPDTRHIERFNLNLRTHLKRLSRKTICFSKSVEMLEACLRIYFWGGHHFQNA